MCQGICSLLGIQIGIGNDFGAVSEEIISEIFVGQVDLTHDVDEVEQFTEEESQGVYVVGALVIVQEADDPLNSSVFNIGIDERGLQFQSEGLHLVIFEHFPQIARCEEEQRLEEEDETHPLIVAMIFRRSTVPYGRKRMAIVYIFGLSSVKDRER